MPRNLTVRKDKIQRAANTRLLSKEPPQCMKAREKDRMSYSIGCPKQNTRTGTAVIKREGYVFYFTQEKDTEKHPGEKQFNKLLYKKSFALWGSDNPI